MLHLIYEQINNTDKLKADFVPIWLDEYLEYLITFDHYLSLDQIGN